MKVYLCGPINGCADSEAKDWREYVKTMLPDTLDPMRRDYRGREAACVDEIVELDKIDIMNSDVMLVNYVKPSVGTSMEVFFGFERSKLVVVVARPDASISPWLRYHSHKVLHSFIDAVKYIKQVSE